MFKVILTHLTNFARPLCFHMFPLNMTSQTLIWMKVFIRPTKMHLMQPLNKMCQTTILSKVILTRLKRFSRPLPFFMQPLNLTPQTTIQSRDFITHLIPPIHDIIFFANILPIYMGNIDSMYVYTNF